MATKKALTRISVMNAIHDAQLASGSEWICADDIQGMLPSMGESDLQEALYTATRAGFLWFDGSSYAVRTTLNRLEQRSYSEVLQACQQLGRPVAVSEIKTVDREQLSRELSRLVYKGYLRQANGRYTPTRQAHATPTMPLAAAKRPRKKTVAKARVGANQEAALVVTAQQATPSLSARFRALAAALLALFVRP
jgi:hypothetical protein